MKYDKLEKELYKINNDVTSLESILAKDEQVIWRGKPKKSAFLFASIVKDIPNLILGLIPIVVFFVIIALNFGMETFWVSFIFVSIFLAIGLFKRIGKIITDSYRYNNIDYALTNRRIIIRSGLIGVDYKSINYKEVKEVKLDVKWIDKLFKVGDIYICTGDEHRFSTRTRKGGKMVNEKVFFDVPNCYEVYSKIQKIIVDIQNDMEHPNALRENNNTSYNTKKKRNR